LRFALHGVPAAAAVALTALLIACGGPVTTQPVVGPPSAPPSSPAPPSASPSSLALFGTGSTNASAFAVSESGYTAAFTESDTCGGIAAITSAVVTGPNATYTVTGTAAGSCTATVSSPFGNVSIPVVVTASGFSVTSHSHAGGQ
jgi:hypothetical protein